MSLAHIEMSYLKNKNKTQRVFNFKRKKKESLVEEWLFITAVPR